MPAIRFNKAFKVVGRVKAFLNLEVGATRGKVPDARQPGSPTQELEKRNWTLGMKEREIGKKDGEIARLKRELAAAREGTTADESEAGTLPGFVIVGAQKCGTTFLYNLLCRHPNVEPAVAKEVSFFDRHFGEGAGWYRSYFPPPTSRDGRRVISGESSPYYLYHPHAARRAAEVVPGARLIVLLRNPVDRAYSNYHHQVRMGNETLSFEEAVEAESERLRGEREKMLADEGYDSVTYRRFSYLSRGVYVDQIKEWRKFFAEEQLLVLKSEKFYESTPETFELVLEHVGLPRWKPDTYERRKARKYSYEPMNPGTRRRLEEFFGPHNRRLYDYLGTDFGW